MKTHCEKSPTNYSKVVFEGVESFGAYFSTWKVAPEDMPRQGDKILVKTKAGEIHTRTIGRKNKTFKGYLILQLVADEEIAKKAAEKIKAHVKDQPQTGHVLNGWCNKCQSYCYSDCEAA